MKKIYTLIPSLLFACVVTAQQVPVMPGNSGAPVNMSEVKNLKRSQMGTIDNSRSAANITMYIDYSASAFDDGSYVWRFNSNYGGTDTALNYVGVALAELTGFTDYADVAGTYTSFTPYPGIPVTIDSIYAYFTHENNSGQYDRLVAKIVTLNSSGALATSASTLWSQTDSFNVSQSSGGSWLGTGAGFIMGYEPNFTTNPGQRVGIVFEYWDPTKLDTFSIQAGFVDDGTGGTTIQSPFPYSYMRYPPFITTVSKNANIGYGTPVGSAGWFEAQNWGIWAKVTYPDPTGINGVENNVAALYQNTPNPFNGMTTIRYDLDKDSRIEFEIHDITGKLVKHIDEGQMASGKHTITLNSTDLTKGVYFYTLKTEAGSLTKRMIITQ
jgi:hypothetical protein